MFLSTQDFATVVRSTPLISIDLIVENAQGEYLLGKRTNRPAQGFWFVPGGRVQKDETLADAFARLTQAELGLSLPISAGSGPAPPALSGRRRRRAFHLSARDRQEQTRTPAPGGWCVCQADIRPVRSPQSDRLR